MKHTKLLSLTLLFVLLVSFVLAETANAAYQFGTVYIQHREYEDGRSNNKAFFEIIDENGNFISNVDVVTEAKLYDPNGNQVVIPEWTAEPDIDIFSPEFLDQGTTNAQYLQVLYEAFFNRDPDSAGYSAWLQKLNNNEMSRIEILNGFTGAQEFLNLCKDYGITAQ